MGSTDDTFQNDRNAVDVVVFADDAADEEEEGKGEGGEGDRVEVLVLVLLEDDD